jgi:putative NIF3 family GTP cyclohydrolase 1 type 2
MRAREIAEEFGKIAPIESADQSDRDYGHLGFRFGDPDVEVTGVGVSWGMEAAIVEEAIARGLNMLLTHEPTLFFWTKSDWHTSLPPETNPVNLRQKRLLIEHDMCVYTAHTNWDLQREVGMLPTSARALGFTDRVTRDHAIGIYRVGPLPFSQLIERVKKTTGLARLRVHGDDGRPIETVALGFGNLGRVVDTIQANRADAGVFGELDEQAFIAAREADVPLIEATHQMSESIGFRNVVDVMSKRLPEVHFEFIDLPPAYRWA